MSATEQAVAVAEFLITRECSSWLAAYCDALHMLGEEAKDQWTTDDVVDAILRAQAKYESMREQHNNE